MESKKIRVNLYSCDGKVKKKITLPEVFGTEYRPDIIRKCFLVSMSNKRQPYGADPTAGMKHAVDWPGKGRGLARTPRLDGGTGRGAQAPNTVGGRRAHPPKAEKDWSRKINKKEARLARMSALACTARVELVRARGHRVGDKLTLPVIVEKKFEDIKSVKDAISVLQKIGVYDDILRAKNGRKIRAGKGKMRGRKYKCPKSLLIILSKGDAIKYFRNLPGVDAVTPNLVTIQHLAPGGVAGRLTVISEDALKAIEEGWR